MQVTPQKTVFDHKKCMLLEGHTEYFVGCLHYSKTSLKRPLKRRSKIDFQDRLSLNAGQKYCRMLQWEHSAILLTFIKLPFVI